MSRLRHRAPAAAAIALAIRVLACGGGQDGGAPPGAPAAQSCNMTSDCAVPAAVCRDASTVTSFTDVACVGAVCVSTAVDSACKVGTCQAGSCSPGTGVGGSTMTTGEKCGTANDCTKAPPSSCAGSTLVYYSDATCAGGFCKWSSAATTCNRIPAPCLRRAAACSAAAWPGVSLRARVPCRRAGTGAGRLARRSPTAKIRRPRRAPARFFSSTRRNRRATRGGASGARPRWRVPICRAR